MTEHECRLRAMIEPNQQTWDMSPNDVAAIAAMLKERDDWRTACREKVRALDLWEAVAKEADVPNWNGSEYSDEFGWAKRVFERVYALEKAIREHHSQKADDRCIDDDTRLYAAAGLPPADHRVGDKFEMVKNCIRFVERRCEGGGWPTYQQLHAALEHIVKFAMYDDVRELARKALEA